MDRFNEFRLTTNRYVYNRYTKFYHAKYHDLHCEWCQYHKGENYDGNYYFGKKRPNWKLVSKNKKQWMKKPRMKTKTHIRYLYGEVTEIII